jgi:uncharacterized protein YfaP (DUF2135 family)
LFKAMIAQRRGDASPLSGDAARACVVKGVSRLPVQRALSLVLTWEDDRADVDLHVTGPTGEKVHFKNRNGTDGGLLYYDVTDGYGPEIYTLGDARPGAYEVSVVYYGGSAKLLRAHLTVLEDAGTPAERRRDIPITLWSADPDNVVRVASLTP